MAPQDDLTAERAADLIQSVFLANEKQWRAWYALANSGSAQQSAPDGVAQKLVDAVAAAIKTVRQEALREAAKVCRDRAVLLEPSSKRWALNMVSKAKSDEANDLADKLDRLASEGG